MKEFKSEHNSEILSQKEIRRYALQINNPLLGVSGQEKIKKARVLVIGAGGKGTSALENLATIGIGYIGISDNYPVQEAELSRQHLYGNGDLGKQKAIISREKLQDINHLVSFNLHNVFLTESNINSIAGPYDILVDATGNFKAHFLLGEAAVKLKKPLVFACVYKGLGYITVFNYQGGPALESLFPKAIDTTLKNLPSVFVCQTSLMSILGAIIANEVVRITLGEETALSGKVLCVNPSDYMNSRLTFKEAQSIFYA